MDIFKHCKHCKKEITGEKRRRHAKFCSKECKDAYKKKHHKPYYPGLSTATIGAMNELLVAADLMKRGFDVFRALSPSCSCDLAVVKDGTLLRIEVRTGWRNKDGKLFKHSKKHYKEKYDVKAIFIKWEERIKYVPSLKKALKRARKYKHRVSFI